jgi:PST family polysaccharide transporter
VLPRLSFSSLYTVVKALLVMAVVLIVYQLLWPVIVRDEGNQYALVALTSVVLGGLVYMSTILKMGMFTLEELAMLPLGGKLAKLGRKR